MFIIVIQQENLANASGFIRNRLEHENHVKMFTLSEYDLWCSLAGDLKEC